jgi:hypothetical protein
VSKRLARWGPADVIGRVILSALVAAVVVGLLQSVVAFAEIAVEEPLFVAGYLALVAVVALPYRFAARAWRARRPRWTRPGLWPSWVPKDITDGLTLAGCALFFGGGGVLLVAEGLDHGFGGFTPVVVGSLSALFGVACVAGCVRLFAPGRRPWPRWRPNR